jgi:phage terminase small subunit
MKFVYELMKDPSNATQAAVRAGVPIKSARVWASDAINSKPNTKKMIQAVLGDQIQGLRVEAEDVLKRIAHVAMTDVTEVVNWVDNQVILNDSDNLSEGARALVSEVTEQLNADGGRTLKVKTRDSLGAMKLLCQYFGVLEKSAQAKRRPHMEQIEAVKAVRDGTKTPIEAALDLEAMGVPIPETIRIMMTKWEEPEEEDFTGDIPTAEEMWERRKAKLAEIEAQKEEFLPERQAEVRALKADLGDKNNAFKPVSNGENKK